MQLSTSCLRIKNVPPMRQKLRRPYCCYCGPFGNLWHIMCMHIVLFRFWGGKQMSQPTNPLITQQWQHSTFTYYALCTTTIIASIFHKFGFHLTLYNFVRPLSRLTAVTSHWWAAFADQGNTFSCQIWLQDCHDHSPHCSASTLTSPLHCHVYMLQDSCITSNCKVFHGFHKIGLFSNFTKFSKYLLRNLRKQ